MQEDMNQSDLANKQRKIESETDDLVSKLIKENKIIRPSWLVSQNGRFTLLIIILLLCGVSSAIYQEWLFRNSGLNNLPDGLNNLPDGLSVATVLFTFTGAVFTYYQWIDARREASLDKFYDRLQLINERYCKSEVARTLVGHFWGKNGGKNEDDFERTMYVYLELDNLEYILNRFELGFVSKQVLKRAVRTFRTRCQSEEFATLASILVTKAGYHIKTAEVVWALTNIG